MLAPDPLQSSERVRPRDSQHGPLPLIKAKINAPANFMNCIQKYKQISRAVYWHRSKFTLYMYMVKWHVNRLICTGFRSVAASVIFNHSYYTLSFQILIFRISQGLPCTAVRPHFNHHGQQPKYFPMFLQSTLPCLTKNISAPFHKQTWSEAGYFHFFLNIFWIVSVEGLSACGCLDLCGLTDATIPMNCWEKSELTSDTAPLHLTATSVSIHHRGILHSCQSGGRRQPHHSLLGCPTVEYWGWVYDNTASATACLAAICEGSSLMIVECEYPPPSTCHQLLILPSLLHIASRRPHRL